MKDLPSTIFMDCVVCDFSSSGKTQHTHAAPVVPQAEVPEEAVLRVLQPVMQFWKCFDERNLKRISRLPKDSTVGNE